MILTITDRERELQTANAELRAELAAFKQQEPFAYIRKDQLRQALPGGFLCEVTGTKRPDLVGFYLAPVADYAPLTDTQIIAILGDEMDSSDETFVQFARAIERAVRGGK